jgi:hypothetical protein
MRYSEKSIATNDSQELKQLNSIREASEIKQIDQRFADLSMRDQKFLSDKSASLHFCCSLN